jgi:Mlc titration factor MtfA (ptsG expression regulator)
MKEPYRYGKGMLICQEFQDSIEQIATHPECMNMLKGLPMDYQMALAKDEHLEDDMSLGMAANKEFASRTGIHGTHLGAVKTALKICARQLHGDLREYAQNEYS